MDFPCIADNPINLVGFVIPQHYAETCLYFETNAFVNNKDCSLVIGNSHSDYNLVRIFERPPPSLVITAIIQNNRSLQELVRLLLTHANVDTDVIDWLYDNIYRENQIPNGGFLDIFPLKLRKLVLQYY